MSKDKANDGGPAFPAHDYVVGDLQKDGFQKLGESRGMTLRAWLAGMAISGEAYSSQYDPKEYAKAACNLADAVIAELEKDK